MRVLGHARGFSAACPGDQLIAAVREAKARSKSAAEFKQLMVANYVDGEKNDEGYRPLPGAGVSYRFRAMESG